MRKRDVTISLSRETVRKATVLACRRKTSISDLLAEQIDILYGKEEEYERAKRQALVLLDHGFPLGGAIRATRQESHER